jgi:hypothetical protein
MWRTTKIIGYVPNKNADLYVCLVITHSLPDKVAIVTSRQVARIRLQHGNDMCPFGLCQEGSSFWILDTLKGLTMQVQARTIKRTSCMPKYAAKATKTVTFVVCVSHQYQDLLWMNRTDAFKAKL